jgi:Flp pilus assembly protein TadG
VFFILLSLIIVFVSAFIYETAQQTVTQTVQEIANITLKDSALGNIEEGETKSYTKVNVTDLGAAISIATTKAGVYLHLDSDIDSLSTYYTTYSVTVKFATVPGGSHSVGDPACTLTIASPDSAAINLDAIGTWTFDFEITTTAQSVTSDQSPIANIVVTAEST